MTTNLETAQIEAVVFDYSVLTTADPESTAELIELFEWLRTIGIKILAFSTHQQDLNSALSKRGLPSVDHLITKLDVGKEKGSGEWLDKAAEWVGCPNYKLLYVGDEARDWWTAGDAAVVYLHAEWSESFRLMRHQGTTTAVRAKTPAYVGRFMNQFLLPPPRWEFSLDLPSQKLYLRSLLNPNATLPASSPTSFNLKDVFKYERRILVGKQDAYDLLMFHALTSLYVEGLIRKGFRYMFYPGSKVSSSGSVISKWLEPASKLFQGYFKPDVLVRHKDALDTSLERYHNRYDNVNLTTQLDTVHINPRERGRTTKDRGKLAGKTVVVFDDFTTDGNAMECARLLLLNAGAEKVICVTAGKYKREHQLQIPSVKIDPYARVTYDPSRFKAVSYSLDRNPTVPALMRNLFGTWRDEDGEDSSGPDSAIARSVVR